MQKQIPLTANTVERDIAGQERLVNVYPRASLSSKYPFTLIGTPGLSFFCDLPTHPVLGLHVMEGKMYAVTPSKFYEVYPDGGFVEIGGVNLSGRISIADNGYQVVMVDGSVGYYFDKNTNLVEKITEAGFYPSRTVTYQDGYFIFERKDTSQFYISNLLSVEFDPINFASAEGQPDLLVAVLSDHRELFLFGTNTIEVWYNSGSAAFPFERTQGAFIEKGCAAPYTVAKQDNSVFFVGSDFMVYRLSGYTPIRVSNHAVEDDLRGVDLSSAFAYTYQDEGHLFYIITIPAKSVTWCFDISTNAWHIRESYQFIRSQVNCVAFFSQKNIVGDFQNGRIYQMSNDAYTDDGEPIVREFTLPVVDNGRERFSINSLEIDMGVGVGLNLGQGSSPELRVFYSKDNGNTYGENYKVASIGKMGKYQTRAKVNRFGMARQFTFKIQISDPIPIDIGGAWVEVT